MIYFTSDLHFGHDRRFIYEPRGFNSIQEMNESLVENWNKTVKDDDIVYVLGDFFLGTDLSFVNDTLFKFNGKVHLVLGNHDTPAKVELYQSHEKILSICYATQIKYRKRFFYLSHYPTLTANLETNPKHALCNLFGHTHSKNKFFEDRLYMYNVAVDAHNNFPVSIEQVNEEIKIEIGKCISYLG